jgi:hypothetical protein
LLTDANLIFLGQYILTMSRKEEVREIAHKLLWGLACSSAYDVPENIILDELVSAIERQNHFLTHELLFKSPHYCDGHIEVGVKGMRNIRYVAAALYKFDNVEWFVGCFMREAIQILKYLPQLQ